MLPKVSVIVPIYKVEKYLERCLDSVCNQTYANLQILLINDGSPDRCGAIAEGCAKRDPRVCVIHKENGGLSDARNAGMQLVAGEYTLFVDSDDWMERNMVGEMVEKSIRYGADIVQAGFYYAFDGYLQFDNRYDSGEDDPVVLDNERLMKELVVNERVKNFAWAKLYKTSLIRDIPFRKGVLFEDVFWAHQVMRHVHTYVLLQQPLYFYYQRSDSIVTTYTLRNLDMIRGLKERHRFIERHYPNLVDASYKTILKNCLIHYALLLKNRKKDKGGVHRKEIQVYLKGNYAHFMQAVQDDRRLKRQLRFFRIHPLLNIALILARRVFRKLKLLPAPGELKQLNLHKQ